MLELKESSIRFGEAETSGYHGWATTNKAHFNQISPEKGPKKVIGTASGLGGFHRQGLLFKSRGEVHEEPDPRSASPTYLANVNLGKDKIQFDSMTGIAFKTNTGVPETERQFDQKIHSFMKGKYVTLGNEGGTKESTTKGSFQGREPGGGTVSDVNNSNFKKSIHFGKGKDGPGSCYAKMFMPQAPRFQDVLQASHQNKERKRELLKHDTHLGYHAEAPFSLAMDSYGKKEADNNERERLEFQKRIEK